MHTGGNQTDQQGDGGFTLIELLLVTVVLAILAVVVVASIGGVTGDAESASCKSDGTTLITAVEAFFAQRDAVVIPSADASPDGYEKTLVAEGFLRRPSKYHDLDSIGHLVAVSGSQCTV